MGNGPGPGMMPVSSADGGMNNGGMAMTTRPAMPMGNMQPMRQQMMGMPNQAGNQVSSWRFFTLLLLHQTILAFEYESRVEALKNN